MYFSLFLFCIQVYFEKELLLKILSLRIVLFATLLYSYKNTENIIKD